MAPTQRKKYIVAGRNRVKGYEIAQGTNSLFLSNSIKEAMRRHYESITVFELREDGKYHEFKILKKGGKTYFSSVPSDFFDNLL